MVHYPLYWPVTFMELQNIPNPFSEMSFCGKSDIYVVLKHLFPSFSPSASIVLHDTAQRLRFMTSEYVQYH